MRFLGKFSLCLMFLTFPSVLPSTSPVNDCGWRAWGADFQPLGSNGSQGKNGQRGNNGQNRDSLTLFADGSPTEINLVGQDGANGENGQDGQDAKCVTQPPQAERNLQAANGGNGGDGGDGGDGGNGGNLTIYSTNTANLQQIKVNATAGKGGQPGNGGKGGKGCNCTEPYWTVETCKGKPGDSNYRCTTREFRCVDGLNGTNGGGGRLGREGRIGQLTLINLNRPLEDDKPKATVTLAQLKDQGVTLSKNQWETRTGALSLLAPGSTLDDQYRFLTQRLEHSFLLIWNAPQPVDKFANQRFTLSLDETQGVNVEISSQMWVEGTTQKKDNRTQFIVYNAVLEKDATALESQGISGNKNNLQLTLIDKANLSNLVGTKFKVKYQVTRSDPRFRPVSDYRTKYEGEIPADLISLQGNKFTLKIGQLPIELDALEPGLGIEIQLIVTRSFGGYAKDQTLVIRDVIPGLR